MQYDYKCKECGIVETIWTPSTSELKSVTCTKCDKDMKRIYNAIKQINAPTGACKED